VVVVVVVVVVVGMPLRRCGWSGGIMSGGLASRAGMRYPWGAAN
jgi:hypothetical protein